MVQISTTFSSLLLVAASVIAVPTSSKTSQPHAPFGCSKIQTKPNFACSALEAPLQGFLTYQANNLEISTQEAFAQITDLTEKAIPAKDVSGLLETVFGGLLNSGISGVGSVVAGLGAGLDAADPDCKCNLASCNLYINQAQGQAGEAAAGLEGSCRQAKFTCASFYKNSQINEIVPQCKGFGADSP